MFTTKTFMAIVMVFASNLLPGSSANNPNCNGIRDFEDCGAGSSDFCPTHINCLCRNEKPFCSCPNYKDDWIDYWYMGPQCEQLWSTIDLILVATLPGIALTMLVAVIIQIVHCCNQPKAPKTSQPKTQTSKQRRKESEKNEQDNYAFISERSPKVPTVSLYTAQAPVEPDYPYIPRLQSPNMNPQQSSTHPNAYSPMPHYPNMVPSRNHPSSPVSHYSPYRQDQQSRYERDYAEDAYDNYSSTLPMRPIPKSAVPVFPQNGLRQSQYGASNNFQ